MRADYPYGPKEFERALNADDAAVGDGRSAG
jgi:hypothetical protein